jgi:hypothetical protein
MSRGIWVNSNGTWQKVATAHIGPDNLTAGYVNRNGIWVKFWPSDAITLSITLLGAGGGGGNGTSTKPGRPGYAGHLLTGKLPVNTTDTIQIYVGGPGGSGQIIPNRGNGSRKFDGMDGAIDGLFGGGGGGAASAIVVNNISAVVAAGGAGGAGGGGAVGGVGGGVTQAGISGLDLSPGCIVNIDKNEGIAGTNGSAGYVKISYNSATKQPRFTGGDTITNDNGFVTHTFITAGATTLSGIN